MRRMDPAEARHLTRQLDKAADDLDGCRRRLGNALSQLRLDSPRELEWIAGDLRGLARELDRRVAIIEQADRAEQSAAAASVAAAFSGLLRHGVRRAASPIAPPSSPGPQRSPAVTAPAVESRPSPAAIPHDQGRLGASDARRIRGKLKGGLFRLTDPKGAREDPGPGQGKGG